MNPQEFVKAMTFLGIAYNKEFTKEQCDVWFNFFKNDDIEIFKLAIKRLIVNEKFIPSIAMVKDEITNIANPSLQLDAEEEWLNVLECVRKYGRNNFIGAKEELDDITVETIRKVGWVRICNSEFIATEKKEFIDVFNILKTRKKNDEKFLALPNVAERLQLK